MPSGPRTRSALAAAAAMAALLPAAALAHVEITPPYVEDGVEATISFATPNERAPHATIRLTVTAPPGIDVHAATAPPGWRAAVSGSTATWSGGRIEGRDTVGFDLRITPRVRAGSHAFAAVQTYDDGAKVRWDAQLSVLPATGVAAPRQHPWGAVAAAVIGVVVVVLSVLGLRRLRRRSLPQG